MNYLYRLLSGITPLFFNLGSLFNSKIKLGNEGRKLQNVIPRVSSIWIHCASLGEYDMAIPIIDQFLSEDEKVVLTFFSPSGKEIVSKKRLDIDIYYLPFDTKNRIETFIKATNPKLVCFIKAEIWPNTLEVVQQSRIPNTLIASVFKSDNFLLSKSMDFANSLLKKMNYISTQDLDSVTVLNSHGFSNAEFTGNPRVDRILQRKSSSSEIPTIKSWKKNDFLLILGSSWPEEEDLVLTYLKKTNSPFKILIAPHDIKRAEKIANKFSEYTPVLFTEYQENRTSSQVMILDTIGHLADAYQYADAVIVGGGFGQGIHNVLEPAVYEIPIGFGPNYKKFPEAENLLSRNAVCLLRNNEDIYNFLEKSRNTEYRNLVSTKMHQYFEENKGATEKIMTKLNSLLTVRHDD